MSSTPHPPAGDGDPPVAPRRRRRRRYPTPPMRVRVAVVVATLAIIIGAGIAAGLKASSGGLSDQGPAPAFTLPSVSDPSQTVSLSQFSGHPVVVNFWGSWCPPCRGELPLLAAAARSHPSIRFVGIDVEDTIPAAQATMARYNIPYPSGFDPKDTVTGRFKVTGTPTTILINAKGHVVATYGGAINASLLDSWLSKLPSA